MYIYEILYQIILIVMMHVVKLFRGRYAFMVAHVEGMREQSIGTWILMKVHRISLLKFYLYTPILSIIVL